MKAYTGKRVFDGESTTRGEAFVVVENVEDGQPSDRRPLTHVPLPLARRLSSGAYLRATRRLLDGKLGNPAKDCQGIDRVEGQVAVRVGCVR